MPFKTVITREPQESDYPWLYRLAGASSAYSIPHTREISNDAVKARTVSDYRILVRDSNTRIFIAQEADSNTRYGFILLRVHQVGDRTGEPECVLYDLAVEPQYWGTEAARMLIMAATKCAFAHGHKYLVGQVAAENVRTLKRALHHGFVVEAHTVVIGCCEQGAAPLKLRPELQQAHLQSRQMIEARRRLARPRPQPAPDVDPNS